MKWCMITILIGMQVMGLSLTLHTDSLEMANQKLGAIPQEQIDGL